VNKLGDLTIGYSARVNSAKNIKFIEGVRNLVVIQNPGGETLPAFDTSVRVIEQKTTGVTKSRNAVIDNTDSKYLVFGDDDITFKSDAIARVLEHFEANPKVSIILTQAVDETGSLRKPYPTKSHKLKVTNSAKAATYELFIRVDAIKKHGIRFDEGFGAGAPNYLGDEYIFIADGIRAGLKGIFLPIVVATHPTDSSGNFKNTREDTKVRAAIFSRVFGFWAPIMRLLFLIKPPAKKFGLRNSVLFVIGK
jgi:glycosyltransferase involved in cell wall biosynthesis